jgi:hypothetical protein
VKRIAACCALAVAVTTVSGCFEIVKFGVQHSIGARLGPCQSSKDSVQSVLGKPYRRMFSDAELTSPNTQIFFHEWGYLLPKESSATPSRSDSAAALPDSVRVIGFRWGYGVRGCDVRDRRAKKMNHPSLPWEGAGDIPGG